MEIFELVGLGLAAWVGGGEAKDLRGQRTHIVVLRRYS